jgi:uncharacterized protein (TIGR02996 family)
MVRYEYIKGTSKKFWEIDVEDKKVITRFGRIGSNGQEKVKKFTNAWEASRYKTSQVRSKEKKGYKLVRAAVPGAEPNAARDPELEAMIAADPERPEGYMVYADWLQAQGDPRGELISVEHALLSSPQGRKLAGRHGGGSSRTKKLLEERARLRAPYDRQLQGLVEPFGWQPPLDETRAKLTWGLGFVKSAWLGHDWFADMDLPADLMNTREFFNTLLSLPSMRLLQELAVGLWRDHDGRCDYGDVFAALAAADLPALGRLFVGDFRYPEEIEISWTELGDVTPIYGGALPRLRELVLQGGKMALGTIDHPELRAFEVRTGGFSKQNVESIAGARWPRLERLELWFGHHWYGCDVQVEDIEPILAGEGIPGVRHLGLRNAEFTDALCGRLGGAKVLDQLESLDLSMGIMTDEGAAALAGARDRLRHLRRLDVSDNYLTPKGERLVKGLCREVVTGGQKQPDVWDGEEHRYVSVGE